VHVQQFPEARTGSVAQVQVVLQYLVFTQQGQMQKNLQRLSISSHNNEFSNASIEGLGS
jgi:hypothetical protein